MAFSTVTTVRTSNLTSSVYSWEECIDEFTNEGLHVSYFTGTSAEAFNSCGRLIKNISFENYIF
jgi:hypothetical protein